ncbi:metallophosphoesterase family protein [Flexithrix dorotheae]|uniref:metallophosphoesterase family protein n=1 Tax=Flexithrix dorotheae TaxID=70993 RepID=UPI00036F757E|nr:exonuclease subunit SbcD [Flexithrix dorotheae]
MKLLHTGDWHLGKRLNDLPRLEEQKQVLEEIIEIAEREEVDAIIIAGDLYDQFNPPNEAIELFYKSVHKLSNNGKRAVIAISGNHDSPDRIEAPDPLAKACGIILVGYPSTEVSPMALESGLSITRSAQGFVELQLPNANVPLRILLTPYANEGRLKQFLGIENQEEQLRMVLKNNWKELAKKYCDDKGVNILMAHLFMMKKGGEKPEEPEDERHILHVGGAQPIYSEDIPKEIQYTALGHLHRLHHVNQEGKSPALYSGSLLEYSFSEANQKKYVVIIEAEPGKDVKYNKLELESGKKLFRKKFEDKDLAIEWLKGNPDTFVELTLVSDSFITAQTKKELYNVHSGIVSIIPEIKNLDKIQGEQNVIDLSKNIDQLFKDYFKHKNGQEANEEIMNLFHEIING